MWYFSITFSQMITVLSRLFVDMWGIVSTIFWHCSPQIRGDPVCCDLTGLTAANSPTDTSSPWTVIRVLAASASREFTLSPTLFISLLKPYSLRFFFHKQWLYSKYFLASVIQSEVCIEHSISQLAKSTDTVDQHAPSIHWLNFINRSLSIQRDLQK